MNRLRLIMLAAAVLVVVVPRLPDFMPKPTPPPDGLTVPAPTGKFMEAVKPICGKVTDAKDRQQIASFYAAFADTIERDSTIVNNTQQFRTANERATRLCFQGLGIHGKYTGLPEAISKASVGVIGLDIAPMDAAKRADTVEVLWAIAWAVGEAG